MSLEVESGTEFMFDGSDCDDNRGGKDRYDGDDDDWGEVGGKEKGGKEGDTP